MTPIAIDARPVVSTTDLGTRPEREITEIVAGFLKLGEGVVAQELRALAAQRVGDFRGKWPFSEFAAHAASANA